MRSRTPTFIWIPFVFSIGTISWAMLLVGLVLLSAVIIAPAVKDVKDTEATRNNYQATLDLLNEKLALQKQFLAAAPTDPMLMDRLASRQLNRNRPNEEVLHADALLRAKIAKQTGNPAYAIAPPKDRSVEGLLAQSLTPPTVKPVAPMPAALEATMAPGFREMLILIACVSMGLSFFLGVKYERE